MNRRTAGAIISIFFFLYFFNSLHPMSFGDDYLYSFVWQGQSMYTPISEDAIRVSSWHELFVSQWSHYFTWSGRTVAHILIQLFLWLGKDVFNIFNAFIGTLLIIEIYWCSQKGVVSSNLEAERLCWIFFVLWAFTPGFTPVFFWLTGACNYLWTSVILLGFTIPYIKKYYFCSDVIYKNSCFAFVMLLWGILAGWTNENSVCWIIVLLITFVFWCHKNHTVEHWMFTGLVGVLIGYALLIFAPGNIARLHAEHGTSVWLNVKMLKENFYTFAMILFFQIFLWFFTLRAFFTLSHVFISKLENERMNREILLVRCFYLLSFGMSGIMIFSPGFPARSGFLGTVQLVIAACILLRIQKEYCVELVQPNAKKFLFIVGAFYFVMTSGVTGYNIYLQKLHMQEIILSAKENSQVNSNDILEVKRFKKLQKWEELAGGFHIPDLELSEEDNNWINVAFSRYYGIKGIRMEKALSENDENRK